MFDSITGRGFDVTEFVDRYGVVCSLQKSSLAFEDAIWLGVNDADPKVLIEGAGWVNYPIHESVLFTTRMHLIQEMVKSLLPYLIRFAETGDIS